LLEQAVPIEVAQVLFEGEVSGEGDGAEEEDRDKDRDQQSHGGRRGEGAEGGRFHRYLKRWDPPDGASIPVKTLPRTTRVIRFGTHRGDFGV
jgi:hypothetical protein